MEGDYIEDVRTKKDGSLELIVASDGGIYASNPNGANCLEDLSGSAAILLNEQEVKELVLDLMEYLVERRRLKRLKK